MMPPMLRPTSPLRYRKDYTVTTPKSTKNAAAPITCAGSAPADEVIA